MEGDHAGCCRHQQKSVAHTWSRKVIGDRADAGLLHDLATCGVESVDDPVLADRPQPPGREKGRSPADASTPDKMERRRRRPDAESDRTAETGNVHRRSIDDGAAIDVLVTQTSQARLAAANSAQVTPAGSRQCATCPRGRPGRQPGESEQSSCRDPRHCSSSSYWGEVLLKAKGRRELEHTVAVVVGLTR